MIPENHNSFCSLYISSSYSSVEEMPVPYPALRNITSTCVASVLSESYVNETVLVKAFTTTSLTPSTSDKIFSIWGAHAAQLMPFKANAALSCIDLPTFCFFQAKDVHASHSHTRSYRNSNNKNPPANCISTKLEECRIPRSPYINRWTK
ncbi:hypothetical protein D3C73_671740 [compost metagenome]